MAKRNRCLEALVLVCLRMARGWTQKKLADALGMDEKKLCRYEIRESLSLEELDVLVAPLGYPPETVGLLLSVLRRISTPYESEAAASPVPLTVAERERIVRTAWTAGQGVEEALAAELTRMKRREKMDAAVQMAEAMYLHLAPLPAQERRRIVTALPVFHHWALARRFCAASLKAAADKAGSRLGAGQPRSLYRGEGAGGGALSLAPSGLVLGPPGQRPSGGHGLRRGRRGVHPSLAALARR